MKNTILTCSVVVYKESLPFLHKTIQSFLNLSIQKKLFLIDNTSDRFFEYVFVDDCIEYIPVEENIGFGSAHNRIIDEIKKFSKYHLILNPDVFFGESIINTLIKELQKNDQIAMIAPKVMFPNGSYQFSCRRYPRAYELLARRFTFLKPFFKNIINKGQYIDKDLNKPFYADYLTGCFHLYKTDDFVTINGFDERYFLYMEDVDICKKIDQLGKKKLYYPNVEITHILKQGSLKDLKLFFNHTSSAIKYFLKWGFR